MVAGPEDPRLGVQVVAPVPPAGDAVEAAEPLSAGAARRPEPGPARRRSPGDQPGHHRADLRLPPGQPGDDAPVVAAQFDPGAVAGSSDQTGAHLIGAATRT